MTIQEIESKMKKLEELAKLYPEKRPTLRLQYRCLLKAKEKHELNY